jgi:hypothetical protein
MTVLDNSPTLATRGIIVYGTSTIYRTIFRTEKCLSVRNLKPLCKSAKVSFIENPNGHWPSICLTFGLPPSQLQDFLLYLFNLSLQFCHHSQLDDERIYNRNIKIYDLSTQMFFLPNLCFSGCNLHNNLAHVSVEGVK